MDVALILVALVHLIVVHGLDGREFEINSNQISTLAPPKKDGVLAPSGCVIHMANGTFLSAVESCADIIKLIEGD